MSELTTLTIAEASKALAQKEITSVELTQAHLKKMEATRDMNAFITETPDTALKMAKEADIRIQSGQSSPGLLEGIPIGIKDLFCTKGIKTTAGSKILSNFIPPYESTVSNNLLKAGVVLLGKTNMDEFAMGSSNLSSAFGPVKSPWKARNENKTFVPGGSSGGSAAAVAAGSVMAATGTDTGGSIRQPAAFCGIVGVKPTYGLCSRWGIVAFASSLDQAGPMCKTVRDASIMLEAMASFDPKDATSLKVDIPSYHSLLNGNVKGLKIGIPKEYQEEGLNAEIQKNWEQGIEWFKNAGAKIIEVSLKYNKYALPTYYIIAPAEASSNLARYDGVRYGLRVPDEHLIQMYEKTRADGFGEEVQRRILIGTYVLSAGYYDAYYVKAQKIKRLICEDFNQAFNHVDLILSPITPSAAFAIGEEPKDPVSMYMNDVLTVPANIAGLPAMSVPSGLTRTGLPLGLQLIAPPLEEARMLNAGYYLEEAAQFTKQVIDFRKTI